ncbi:hypothetical protein ACJMK2_024446 [Sinanodonta woodiana]|uniref:Uncharacterized protein n=1 Tax=Sinanodonta woodiana TaxID=1069815 RepID=A0ABD3XFU1_SINWO
MARCNCDFLPRLFLTLILTRSLYTIQGFECHVANESTGWTDDNINSFTLTWNCTLISNESKLSILWSKENMCVAKATQGNFTPCSAYEGRVEKFGTFGISLNSISRKDSGHYTIVILDGNITECSQCQSIYMLVLMEQRHNLNAQPVDGRLSELNIGLICGLILLTVIGLAQCLLCFVRGSGAGQTRNKNTYPDQIGMLQSPIRNE